MRYSLELTLNKSLAEVWKIFNDRDNLNKWQPSLINVEQLEGMAGEPGSVAKLTFKNGEREYSLLEKIIQRVENERLDQLYQNEFADNTIKNTFLENGDNETLWNVEVEFKFKTVLMRILGPFVKSRFSTNTRRDMERFKDLVENS